MVDVQVVERLVEDQHLGLLRECACHLDALSFPTGQAAPPPVLRPGHPHVSQGSAAHVVTVGVRAAEPRTERQPTEADDVEHTVVDVRVPRLLDERQPSGDRSAPEPPEVLAGEQDRPALRNGDPGEASGERRLARPVRSHDPRDAASLSGQVHVPDECGAADRARDPSRFQGRRAPGPPGLLAGHARRPRRRTTRKTGTPMSAVTTPTGIWCGANARRPTRSASTRNTPPPRADTGNRRR